VGELLKRMTTAAKSKIAWVVVTGVIVVLFSFLFRPSVSLEFKERSFPEGFRELVVDSGVSRLDPILGLPAGRYERGAKRSVKDICDALFRDPESPTAGKQGSATKVVTFFDYRCPYCRTLSRLLFGMLGGDLQLTFKEWPVLGEPSVLAARAALAAAQQGRYAPFHQHMMESRFIPTPSLIENLAAQTGIDRSQLREDMDRSDVGGAIARNHALASELGFVGTPALVVGRTIIQGAVTRQQLENLVRNPESRALPSGC
jgi:protein-disulfide isomerase